MSSHIHLIIGRHGEPSLEGIIRDIKKFNIKGIQGVYEVTNYMELEDTDLGKAWLQ